MENEINAAYFHEDKMNRRKKIIEGVTKPAPFWGVIGLSFQENT